MTVKGSCLCGEVAFQYTAEPVVNALCHCLDCQKWSGGPGTTNAVVPQDAFSVTKGTPKVYVKQGDTGKDSKRYFCGTCGSSLWSEPAAMAGMSVVKGGVLDDGAANLDNKIGLELYVTRRLPFLSAVEGARQVPEFTSL